MKVHPVELNEYTHPIPKISEKVFTERQLRFLQALKVGSKVRDIRVLRKLSKLGIVTLHEHTGHTVGHVLGGVCRAFYIIDAKQFEIEGIGMFRTKYYDGCFNPYLIRASN